MTADQALLDDSSSQKHLILPIDQSLNRVKSHFEFKFRWSHLFLILSICLIISIFVLFWSDEEYSEFLRVIFYLRFLKIVDFTVKQFLKF